MNGISFFFGMFRGQSRSSSPKHRSCHPEPLMLQRTCNEIQLFDAYVDEHNCDADGVSGCHNFQILLGAAGATLVSTSVSRPPLRTRV